MKKSDRISAFVAGLETTAADLDPRYEGYFHCFNQRLYYEAHDVLEDLWLERRDEHWAFFKGLIQFAGAFVHLQKQFLRPQHPKDGRRLAPAARLFRLAAENLDRFRPLHLRLDVEAICAQCDAFAREIEASEFRRNPWTPDNAPRLTLTSHA